jgi:orotate phosphoribosyltransferase
LGAKPSIIDNNIAVTEDEILEHFRKTNALLEGHFVLSSGLHSPTYLQCALALQKPADADRFARELVNRMALDRTIAGVETVASPAIGGLVIGFAVAQAIGVRFIWTERQNGEMTLRRGFEVRKGEKVLVVEDVITTGGSTRECMAALEQNGAEIIAAASIVDRSGGKADVGVPRTSLVTLDVPTCEPANCPLCGSGSTAIKPGSRTSR